MKSIIFVLAILVSYSDAQWEQFYKLKFYYSGGSTDYNQTNITSLLQNPNFKAANPTALYFYGFLQNPKVDVVTSMKDAYVGAGYNFLLFDINALNYNYFTIDAISLQVAKNLLSLFNSGLNLQTFELVGFSIGAQFAGYVARNVSSLSAGSKKLPRVVGLEPAVLSPENVGPKDASFVMTVHTGNSYSNTTVYGHVAFYPNGGLKQPICKKKLWVLSYDDAICSHGQVQLFWIEAVKSKSPNAFPALPCDDDLDFYNNLCNKKTPVGYMNPKTSTALRGAYYLATNMVSPYSKATTGP